LLALLGAHHILHVSRIRVNVECMHNNQWAVNGLKQLVYLFIFYAHGSVHHTSILIKVQVDATVCRYLFTAKSLHMFRVSPHPSSGVLKTVTAATGTGHNMGAATSLQRGQIGTVPTCPRSREVTAPIL